MSGIHSLGDPLYLRHGDLVIEHEYPDTLQTLTGAAGRAVGTAATVAPLLSGLRDFRYDTQGNPSIFNSIRARLTGLGDANTLTYSIPPRVQADMAARPMAKQYALNYLDVASQGTSDPTVYLDVNLTKLQVAADTDPLSEPVAQMVATTVFEGYGASHDEGAALAQQTQDAQSTYQSVAAIPSEIGQAIGAGASAVANVGGSAAGTFLSSLLQNPMTLALIAGGVYFAFFYKKSRSAE